MLLPFWDKISLKINKCQSRKFLASRHIFLCLSFEQFLWKIKSKKVKKLRILWTFWDTLYVYLLLMLCLWWKLWLVLCLHHLILQCNNRVCVFYQFYRIYCKMTMDPIRYPKPNWAVEFVVVLGRTVLWVRFLNGPKSWVLLGLNHLLLTRLLKMCTITTYCWCVNRAVNDG